VSFFESFEYRCLSCGQDVLRMDSAFTPCPRRYLQPHDDAWNALVVEALVSLGWSAGEEVSRAVHLAALGLAHEKQRKTADPSGAPSGSKH